MVTKAKKALLASLAAFLCVMLTVFGLSMSVSLSEKAKAADETSAVAQVGTTTTYGTLKGAIDAAAEGDTVTLLKDTTEDVVVNKNITLDLDGKTLTGTKTDKKASLTVVKGATATVKNGTILGTENGYYTIQNNGTATFEGLTATAGNIDSSMIDNWGTLTISSGTYTGGLNVVKSEENSTLVINDGKFTLEDCPSRGYTAVILVYGDTTINGGEFIQNANRKWANPQVVMTGVVEGAKAPITRVTGGIFTNKSSVLRTEVFWALGDATSANFEVSGGTFNKSIPEGYCANGFIPTKNADGTYGVKEGKYVAKIGSKKYETLADAIRWATKGKTVTLLDNISGNFEIASAKNITLDLNGFTLNGGTGTAEAAITNHGTLTIKDSSAAKTGTIKRDDNGVEGETSYYVIRNLGTMTIEQANVVNNSGYRKTNPSGSMIGSSLICNGDNDEGASLTINGGKLTQLNFLAVKNGANGTLFVNGGEITSNHSAVQNWYNATITGGTIKGQLWTDAYIAGESVGNTVIDGDVQFTGEIYMDITGSIKPELTINGGNLSVTNWRITTACAQKGGKPAVKGGTFTSAVPAEYCADRFIPTQNADGTYGVKACVAKVGSTKYETLAEAIAAAKDGETVKLLADCSGNGIQIESGRFADKGLTVDFDGHTYTVGGVLVGSAGTGTNAFQLLAGGKVTFQNGTIEGVSENTKPAEDTPDWHGAPAIVIQNYCDLTLKNMTVSGGDETVYTMSNNNGDVVLEDTTINAGGAKGYSYGPFAFDVCRYSSYPSVSVTVRGNSVINGNVEISGTIGEGQSRQLNVENGTFNGKFNVSGNVPANIAISGGTFKYAVLPEYCAEGFIPQDNGDGTFGVKEGTYVAKIGEAGYETLAEAIAAAKDGDTITLLANVAEFEGAVVTKNLTFDFGDYTITGKTGATVLHVKNAKVTLNGKTGGIDGGAGGDNIAVRADTGAEVIINGGVYTVGADANGLGNSTVYVTDNGKVTINGGTFSSKAAYNGKYYVLNVQNSAKGTFVVKGGTFKDFDPLSGDDNLGGNFAPEGYGANRDENGNFTIVADVVAQVKNASGKSVKAYATLQEALNAAPRKAIVTLLADTRENVVVDKVYELTFDLNGFTLNGGTEKGKPALTLNNRRLIIKDSSAAQTGTIMREDTAENSGVSSHYVIDIQGDNALLRFESGNVKNNSGVVGVKGSSLVRVGNDSYKSENPTLTIAGGTFTQDNFIVIKVDHGTFYLTGGELNSKNSYALENWLNATVKGGTVNGKVSSWTYSNGSNSTLTISGGTINGNVESVTYDRAAGKLAKVSITGGTVTGTLSHSVYNQSGEADKAMATIEVTGGTFSKDPTKYVVEDSAITKNENGTFGVEKAYLAKVGDTSYYTMDEAFKAQTTSGKAIVLLRDYTTGSTFNSGSINRVVDLNGHTWTYTDTDVNNATFEINYPNVILTVRNGTVVSNSLVGLIPTANSMSGTILYSGSSLVFDGVTMTANGHSGIETNGGNENVNVTLTNCTLNVPNGFGIYFPTSGTLTINNSKINAKTMGVQVCSGELNINAGSAITVTGDAVPKAENDGAIQDGAAISIVNRPGYKGLSNIVITGGTFTAKAGNDAIKAYDWVNKVESTFTKADLVAVSGGTFSSEVNKDYLANGFRLTKTGESYGVTAKYIESTHVSLGTALSFSYKLRALKEGETIKNAKASYRTVRGNLVEIDMTLVDGYYVFDGITPQMLDRKISVNVYVGDTVVYDVVDYSILDYLQDLLNSNLGKATVTKQLVADLAFYGKAAMKYVGYTTAVVDEFIANNGLTQSTGDITGVATSSGTEKVANVSVQFASQNKILIGVAESVFDDYSYTIKVNGTEIDKALWQTDVVDGYRVYVSDGFAASYITDKDHYVEVEVLKNETSVQKVQCNVAGYCMKMAENAKMSELAKATYYYGVSAAEYANFKG